MFKVLDLFSGIGGFSLGLERAGFVTAAFCEIDPFCRLVLKKHWPDIPCYDDVRSLTAEKLRNDGIGVDVICGGFPCQDISKGGRGAGLAGERSGLWREYARLIGDIRPRYVIVENVPALFVRGFGDVLGKLASLGYDAEWHCIPASAVGAPQRRDRLWIVAYPRSERVAGPIVRNIAGVVGPWEWSGDADLRSIADGPFVRGERWPAPLLRGLDARVPRWMDRLRAAGNAVVPQIPELIGRAILASEGAMTADT